MSIRPAPVILGLIIAFYILNGIFYLRAQSLTFDEGSFLNYATRLIKGHPERVFPQSDNWNFTKVNFSTLNISRRIRKSGG